MKMKQMHNASQSSLVKPGRGNTMLPTPKFRGVTGAHKPLSMGGMKSKRK